MASLRSRVIAGKSRRTDFPLVGRRAALLVIDIQKYLSRPQSPEEEQLHQYAFNESIPAAVANIQKLIQTFRVVRDDQEASVDVPMGCEVIFTYLQSCTNNGRDISLDYKLSGSRLSNIPDSTCSKEDIFLEECCPDEIKGKGDILLPKTSCSVFQSTNINYLLRNLGVEQLVVVGQLTDQCVMSAVRDAADLGYLVTVVEDACAANSPEDHVRGLEGIRGFARIMETYQVMDEIVEDLAQVLLEVRSRLKKKSKEKLDSTWANKSCSSLNKKSSSATSRNNKERWNSSWSRFQDETESVDTHEKPSKLRRSASEKNSRKAIRTAAPGGGPREEKESESVNISEKSSKLRRSSSEKIRKRTIRTTASRGSEDKKSHEDAADTSKCKGKPDKVESENANGESTRGTNGSRKPKVPQSASIDEVIKSEIHAASESQDPLPLAVGAIIDSIVEENSQGLVQDSVDSQCKTEEGVVSEVIEEPDSADQKSQAAENITVPTGQHAVEESKMGVKLEDSGEGDPQRKTEESVLSDANQELGSADPKNQYEDKVPAEAQLDSTPVAGQDSSQKEVKVEVGIIEAARKMSPKSQRRATAGSGGATKTAEEPIVSDDTSPDSVATDKAPGDTDSPTKVSNGDSAPKVEEPSIVPDDTSPDSVATDKAPGDTDSPTKVSNGDSAPKVEEPSIVPDDTSPDSVATDKAPGDTDSPTKVSNGVSAPKVTDEAVVEYLRDLGLKNVANDLIKVVEHLKQAQTSSA